MKTNDTINQTAHKILVIIDEEWSWWNSLVHPNATIWKIKRRIQEEILV